MGVTPFRFDLWFSTIRRLSIILLMLAVILAHPRKTGLGVVLLVWGVGLGAILMDIFASRLFLRGDAGALRLRTKRAVQIGQILLDQVALGLGVYHSSGLHSPLVAVYLPYLAAGGLCLGSAVRYAPAFLSVLIVGGIAAFDYLQIIPHSSVGDTVSVWATGWSVVHQIGVFTILAFLSVGGGAWIARHLQWLEAEAKRAKARARQRAQRIAVLQSALQDLDLSLDLQAIAQVIARMALALSTASQVDVLLREAATNTWRLVASQKRPFVTGHGFPDKDTDGSDPGDSLKAEQTVELPLIRRGRSLGVIKLAYIRSSDSAAEDAELLQIMAHQAAIAIENASHYEQMAAERARMQTIVDHVNEGIIVLGRRNEITMMNPAAAEITGWPIEQAQGMSCTDVFRCHDERNLPLCDSDACPLTSAHAPDNSRRHIVIFHRRDGQHVWVDMICSQITNGDEKSSLLCTLRDITELKKLEKLKTEFIASVSHELRSPLTIIRAYSQILERALSHDEELLYYATAIDEESHHLSKLVDDLLDLSRIEAGRLRLNLEWCDLAEMILETVRTYEGYTREHTIHVDVRARPLLARVDPVRVRQVLTNLINNAIKYSPEGSRIDIRLVSEGDQHKRWARISVRDEGPGIPPEHQQRIFERFYQINPSQAGGEGVGLGLPISKAIVEAHGGQIWVESEPGHGSTFHFTLPLPTITLLANEESFEAG